MAHSGTALAPARYNQILLLVAGLGGLLYGIDVGIIASALPYLEATSGLNSGQLSVVVAAVLLGSIFSTLCAGMLADRFGRKPMMVVSGALFVLSIPSIALSHGYGALVAGRLLQGISGGFCGVVVPLYLAECLTAHARGKGTAIFQWMLTLGIVAASLVGIFFSYRVAAVEAAGTAAQVFAFKNLAWRGIFWTSLPPGVLFVMGALWVSESPRWLHRRQRTAAALAALRRSRGDAAARHELQEMDAVTAAQTGTAGKVRESLLRRKYVLPFVLACVILAATQGVGVNAIIGYMTDILLSSGLTDLQSHWGYVAFTLVNFLLTIAAVVLVDRKGRKFLLTIGTAGMTVALVAIAVLFWRNEARRVDVRAAVQQEVTSDQSLSLTYRPGYAASLLATARASGAALAAQPTSLVVIYSCGSYQAASDVVRSNDPAPHPITITRAACLPANAVVGFFSNPLGNLAASRQAPLRIDDALITPLPSPTTGWWIEIGLLVYMGFFAVGPGVVVWLALSELMPTRIRSNGMSIALVMNQITSTTITAIFLPTVGRYGYHVLFLGFAAVSVVYFFVSVFFLPETKNKTLEEIEAYFEGPAAAAAFR
jgi:MFS family permease